MITMSRLKPDKMSGPCCRALFGHPAKCQLPGRQQNIIIIIMCGLCWSSSPSPPLWPSPLLRPSRSPVWTDSPVTVQPLRKSHCQVHRRMALANLFFKSSMASHHHHQRHHYHLHRLLLQILSVSVNLTFSILSSRCWKTGRTRSLRFARISTKLGATSVTLSAISEPRGITGKDALVLLI